LRMLFSILGLRNGDAMKSSTIHLGLALWITAMSMGAWLTLWFLSGEFLSSLLAILAPMTLFATR